MTQTKTKLAGWLPPLLIFLLTVTAFFPALDNGFVDLDDDSNFLTNPRYRGLGWAQLRWMFTTFHMGHYQPLSWVTLALDYLFWGMNPFGYHLTNVLLHALNAVVFYFLCARLLSLAMKVAADNFGLRASAGVAALLFAVHPLRVESVAWVTERRDVLSGLFFLLTLLWYLKAATAETKESRRKWLALTLFVYLLSLLSKAIGMTVPAVLLILDVYPLKRLGWGQGRWFGREARWVWLEKAPFVLLAGGAAWLAFLAQNYIGAMIRLVDYGAVERLAQIFYNLAFYIWKTVAPFKLLPLYEIPWDFDPWHWSYIASALAVVGSTAALFFFRRRWPAGLAAGLYYAAMILPVSGIAQSGIQLAGDRYSYLSCLGWAILISGGLLFLWERRLGRSRMTFAFASGAVVLVVAGLGFLTWKQTQVWHDSETLLSYVLNVNSRSKVAHNNFGNILFNRGQVDEAIKHYRGALQVDPYYTFVHFNLAEALSAQGKLDEATQHYREAIRLPGPMKARVAAYTGLGLLLNNQGKSDQAIKSYRQALELDPTFNPAHVNLGDALTARGEFDEAIAQFRQAIQNEPDSALAHHRWGNALLRKGDLEGAMEHYRRTLESEPRNVEVHTNLGSILGARGEDEAAMSHYREALKTDPNYGPAHFNLGVLLGERGKTQEAIEHFRNVVEKNPRDAGGHFYLGRYLAMEGKAEEAAIHFKAVLQIQPGFSEANESLKRLTARQKKS
jgi:tetratricopeptide (TPR) repeat protein